MLAMEILADHLHVIIMVISFILIFNLFYKYLLQASILHFFLYYQGKGKNKLNEEQLLITYLCLLISFAEHLLLLIKR